VEVLPGRLEPWDEPDADVLPAFAPVLPEDVPAVEELLPEPWLPDADEPVAVLPDVPVAPGLESTFSAVRSMVTGRFGGLLEDEPEPLPGLSEAPLPPEEDVPPGDFLSVVI
jgi:hypothetical protein